MRVVRARALHDAAVRGGGVQEGRVVGAQVRRAFDEVALLQAAAQGRAVDQRRLVEVSAGSKVRRGMSAGEAEVAVLQSVLLIGGRE